MKNKVLSPRSKYYKVLNQVIDPELGLGIADMGLIYGIKVRKGIAKVLMTFTTLGCPAGPQITQDVTDILMLQNNIDDVLIEVTFDPPWSLDMMKEEVRAMIYGNI
ncbi:DUF59 domain-containing protein [Candidatus Peregrinibacteria bacterium]|nr:DUF59 domain-containing protein [Candidatus Peregrinibacteria bacterium]